MYQNIRYSFEIGVRIISRTLLHGRTSLATAPAIYTGIGSTFMEELMSKEREIWSDFYITYAMSCDDWKRGGYDLRHIVMRFAVHRFIYKLCKRKRFHQSGTDPVCERCEQSCERYQAMHCAHRHESLTSFCSSDLSVQLTRLASFPLCAFPPSFTIKKFQENGLEPLTAKKSQPNSVEEINL